VIISGEFPVIDDIEWHEMKDDSPGPGVRVNDTDDFSHDVEDYAYELTIATRDPLPHG
jgi:hypothetical protein